MTVIHLFYGPDDFSVREALGEIRIGLGDTALAESNISRLDGAKLKPEELASAAQSMPFFGGKRMVIVEGLLSRFEAKEKRASAKSEASAKKTNSELPAIFAKVFAGVPDSTEVVLLDAEVGRSNPLFKEIASRADVRVFPLLKGSLLDSWVRKRAEKLGVDLSDTARGELIRLVGGDLWVMHGELQKLAAYAMGKPVGIDDIRKLVGLSREASIFTLVDDVIAGRLKPAGEAMYGMLEAGAAPQYILSMLARQLRFLVRAKDLKASGKSDADIQSALGLADFSFRKTLEQATKHTLPRLNDFYRRLLDTDLDIKTGRYDDELALIILITGMSGGG